MKILHTVEFYHPSRGGAQEVVKQISERLAQRGHAVTVATTRLRQRNESVINGVHIAEFDISGNAVRGVTGEVDRYQAFLRDGEFDVMMNYAAQQWATDLVFPVLDDLPYARVMAPCGFSGLFQPQYEDYFAALPDLLRRYDHLIFHCDSYRDIDFARRHGLGNFSVIPNGASEDEFDEAQPGFRRRYGIAAGVPMLLTVGSHTGVKGHAELIEAFRRARIGRAVLVLVANTHDSPGCLPRCRQQARLVGLLSLGRKRVLLLDVPRPTVVAAYHAADLFVFTSNIECSPIVLFEAMAAGLPFLSAPCGNAEEIALWGGGGVIAPARRRPDGFVETDPAKFAEAIERLIDDSATRCRLGTAGRAAWRRRFTWAAIAERYEQVYRQSIANCGAPARRGAGGGERGGRRSVMVGKPLVSVVMSVYNGQHYLRQAIDSILGQTFSNFEFIIVNDGSTDNTADILVVYEARDPRIRVYAWKHHGLIESLNKGCSLARAKYVARIDDDDVALPERLKLQVEFLAANPEVAVLGGAMEAIDGNGTPLGKIEAPVGDAEIKALLPHSNCIAHPTVMMRRDAFEKVGGFRKAFLHCEDYDLWLRIAEEFALGNLSEVLIQHRFHKGKISFQNIEQQQLSRLAAQKVARIRRRTGRDPSEEIDIVTRDFLSKLGVRNDIIEGALFDSYLGVAGYLSRLGYPKEARALRRQARANASTRTKREALAESYLQEALRYYKSGRFWRALCSIYLSAVRSPNTAMQAALRRLRRPISIFLLAVRSPNLARLAALRRLRRILGLEAVAGERRSSARSDDRTGGAE